MGRPATQVAEAANPPRTQRSPRGRPRLAALTVVIPAAALVLWLGWVIGTLAGPGGRNDFATYYAAATALRLDPHANIYTGDVLAHAAAIGHTQPSPPLPYTYPPLLAILLIPLSLLPFSAAATCWLLFNAGLWLFAALLLSRELRALLRPAFAQSDGNERRGLADPARRVALAFAFPLYLLAWPAGSALLLGQVSLLVMLPLALVPWLTRHGREGWVGVAIGCAALLKFTPALLLGYLILRRRWRALVGALVALAALSLVCALIVGPGTYFAAAPQALHVGADDAARPNNQALLGVLLVALDAAAPALAPLAHLLEYVALLAVLSGATFMLRKAPLSAPSTPKPTRTRGVTSAGKTIRRRPTRSIRKRRSSGEGGVVVVDVYRTRYSSRRSRT